MRLVRLAGIPGSLVVVCVVLATANTASAAPAAHASINCEYSTVCAEVADPASAFGPEYVGHDEPSAVFYSNVPGAGNHMSYSFRLPRDPSPDNPNTPGKSYQFELNGALWLGMAMCDTRSYPEQVSTCTPDSDRNIVDPAVSPNHPGHRVHRAAVLPAGVGSMADVAGRGRGKRL